MPGARLWDCAGTGVKVAHLPGAETYLDPGPCCVIVYHGRERDRAREPAALARPRLFRDDLRLGFSPLVFTGRCCRAILGGM